MTAIFIRTVLIYLFLSLIMKLMGKRQIGELEVNELISALLISELVSLPITNSDIPILNAVIPVTLIASLEVILSALKNKSKKIKMVIEGEPVYVIYRGKIKQSALKDNRISINELLSEMRIQEKNDISKIYYAMLEPNGKISFIEKKYKDSVAHTIVIDGAVETKTLNSLCYNEDWLNSQLKKRGLMLSDVFLMTTTDGGKLNIILKEETE